MNVQTALVSQLQAMDSEFNNRKDKSIAKINAQAILDNLRQIINSNKSDAFVASNKEKIAMALKMAKDKINAL